MWWLLNRIQLFTPLKWQPKICCEYNYTWNEWWFQLLITLRRMRKQSPNRFWANLILNDKVLWNNILRNHQKRYIIETNILKTLKSLKQSKMSCQSRNFKRIPLFVWQAAWFQNIHSPNKHVLCCAPNDAQMSKNVAISQRIQKKSPSNPQRGQKPSCNNTNWQLLNCHFANSHRTAGTRSRWSRN